MEWSLFKKPHKVIVQGTCSSYTEISSPTPADLLLLSFKCYKRSSFLTGDYREFLREVAPINNKFYIRKESAEFEFFDCDIVGYKNFPNKVSVKLNQE